MAATARTGAAATATAPAAPATTARTTSPIRCQRLVGGAPTDTTIAHVNQNCACIGLCDSRAIVDVHTTTATAASRHHNGPEARDSTATTAVGPTIPNPTLTAGTHAQGTAASTTPVGFDKSAK